MAASSSENKTRDASEEQHKMQVWQCKPHIQRNVLEAILLFDFSQACCGYPPASKQDILSYTELSYPNLGIHAVEAVFGILKG